MNYFAVVEMLPTQAYRIELPDFPGIEARCDSIAEIELHARRALGRALERRGKEGLEPPRPTSREELKEGTRYRSGVLVRIPTPAS